MAVDATSLTTRYPELAAAVTDYPDMVDGCIAQAQAMVDSDWYGSKADHAIHALAAHFVAINPLGELARIDKKGEKTVYWIQYEQIRKSIGAGCRVI